MPMYFRIELLYFFMLWIEHFQFCFTKEAKKIVI